MSNFIHVFLYQPLYNLLMFLAWLIPGHSIGWAIIVLTILIRLALLPNSLKAAYAQVKSMALQPKINKIRSEIKDQAEQSKALMALYKEEGFSPFGSCLPILIQLPILWLLYSVFRGGLNAAGYSALYHFTPHVAAINTFFLGIDLIHPNVWVLPILAGVLQIILSIMMAPKDIWKKKTEVSNDPMAMMNKQMLFFPAVITVFFGRTMPAALVVYWITTTIFGIAQQWYVNKEIRNQAPSITEVQSKTEQKQIEPAKAEKPKKPELKDMVLNSMQKKLDKKDKKSGVNVTIRTKK